MNKEREICGVKVIVSGETYNEYKGTLEEQLEEKDKEIVRLNNIIDELEKDLDKGFEVYICNGRKTGKSIELGYKICQKELLRKLKELKGETNERQDN